MNNNPQGILSSDRVGTRNNILQPHDIAIGHFGKKQFPKRSDKWALPFGAKVIVWPKGESAFMGTVSDVEAFNKKHPKKAGPGDWIDIWDPEKSRRNITTKGVIFIEVPYCEPCPSSFSELTMDMIPDRSHYA